jgi:putative hydrolase of the HAD superfamily
LDTRTTSAPQHLIFDADDTLWENNVYFERAIEEFLDFLGHSTLSRAEVRAVLDEIERANAAVRGYGARAFAANLRDCYDHLAEQHLGDDATAAIMGFAERILAQEIEVLPDVAETLPILAARHDLTLLTKGHEEDQRLKIDRSGLAGFFRHAAVVPEKDLGAYRSLVAELDLAPARTWMIGNSPKSDVNPALAAGLNAVFLPHHATWSLEQTTLAAPAPDRHLLVLEGFAELLTRF